MKRRIVIGLALYALLFVLGGVYILWTIREATGKLDNLIMLHQVEILREHYLSQLRQVQNDLSLMETRRSPGFEATVRHARGVGAVIHTCGTCHHAAPVAARIKHLQDETQRYKDALSRVLTLRGDEARWVAERDAAFGIGERLTHETGEMIAITGSRLERATQRALGEIAQTRIVLYALVGIGPLLTILLGWLFTSGFTRPVRTLLASTRRLKAGDLEHRVEGLSGEFGELGEAFNDMAASLGRQLSEMQRTEQMVVLGQLSAGLAHEVKNPLAGIKVAMEVLGQDSNLAPEDREVLRKVIQEVARLEGLMRSFLSFAKPPRPQLGPVDVAAVLNAALGLYARHPRLTAEEPERVRIVREFGEVPAAVADAQQLQQVALNLVLNAVEALPPGGTLVVRTAVAAGGEGVDIVFDDDGPGVRAEDAERIFQPFFTTKHGGTGLGLAISRQLIRQQHGTLTLEPKDGPGARFVVRVPAQAG